MKDLDLGSVHLTKAEPQRELFEVWVANLIVQKRNKKTGKVSEILLPELKMALVKLAQEAKRLGASVHLPRIGQRTPNFNWYNIERLLLEVLVRTGVDTFVYYFRRSRDSNPALKRRGSAASEISSPFLDSDSASPSKKSKADPMCRVMLPDIFLGLKIQLFQLKEHSGTDLQRYIVAYGGEVELNHSVQTTHVVTDLPALNLILKNLQKNNASLKIVSPQWLLDCLDAQTRLEEEKYLVQ
jgi:hypothetical protein